MSLSPDPDDYMNLVEAVCSAVGNAFRSPALCEPQLVANLVWELPRAINKLTPSKGVSIKANGVFVHSQPFVKCKTFPNQKPASVEIGDLLLFRTEVCGEYVLNRRALLLQAKKGSDYSVKPDNANQHHLYAKWPPFEYVRSTSGLNGKRRHITGLDLYDASRFLLISDHDCWDPLDLLFCCSSHPYHGCSRTASPTHPKLSHYRPFVRELIYFLLGDAGKSFTRPPPARTRDWDRVINDLITVTAKRSSVFMKRAAGSEQVRGQGPVFCFLSGQPYVSHGILRALCEEKVLRSESSSDGPPQVPDEWFGEDSDSNGISMIEFVVSTEGGTE